MKSILAILLFLIGTQVFAQDFRLTVGNTVREIILNDIPGNVEIRNAPGNEIRIELVFSDRARKPSQVTSGNTDNTGKGLQYEQNTNTITFRNVGPAQIEGKYTIEIPSGIALIVQGPAGFRKMLDINDYRGNLDIRSAHDVTILNLTTGLILQNPSGQVAIRMGAKKINQPISIITESGNVVFHMPRKMGVDLKLGTGTGAITATLSNNKGGSTKINATQFISSLNGGGTDVQIRSLSGNILIVQF